MGLTVFSKSRRLFSAFRAAQWTFNVRTHSIFGCTSVLLYVAIILTYMVFVQFIFQQKGQANFDKLVGTNSAELKLRMSRVRQVSRMSTRDLAFYHHHHRQTRASSLRSPMVSYYKVRIECGVPFIYYSKDRSGLLTDFGRIMAKCPDWIRISKVATLIMK